MKFDKTISLLVLCIAVLSMVASAFGLFLNDGPGNYEFKSIHGETVSIYGKGLYQYDSKNLGPQARAQDAVTIIMGIPLLIASLYFSRRGSLKGRLALAGTLGYFLYTYTMYTAIPYNQMFLVYIMLMTASLYAFILTLMSFDMELLRLSFNQNLPVKLIGGFQIFIAITLLFLWLGDILPSIINGTVPKPWITIPAFLFTQWI